jgi:hypothetical protein
MKNSFYEEKDMKKALVSLHNNSVNKLNIPEWARNIKCPHCSEKVEASGLRQITFCLNARNIGDICVEMHCVLCGIMDTVYFRSEVENSILEFCDLLNGEKNPSSEPILEEEMYKLGYNNLIERFLEE